MSCSSNFVREHVSLVNFFELLVCTWFINCENVYVFCNHQTTECARSAVCGCGMDATTLSFLCTATAIRETMTRRHSQNLRNVCADHTHSRDLSCWEQRTNAKASSQHCCGTNSNDTSGKRNAQKCALCGQGIFIFHLQRIRCVLAPSRPEAEKTP